MNIDATRAHIDAETMAAWADRALPAEEAAAVELHLSNCDRCQEVLAAFVRSAPTTAAVIPFWTRRPVQWSAAGLAAAAALVAMISIGRPPAAQDPVATVASRSEAAELRQDKPAPTPAELKKEGASSLSAREELRRDQQERAPDDKAANQAAAKKAEAGAAATAPPPQAAASPAPPPSPSALAQVALAPPPVTVTAAAPVVTPVGASRPAAASEAVVMDAISAISLTFEVTAPEPSTTALRSMARGAGRGGGGGERALTQSPSPTRWRVVGGTRIERSLDAGATWTSLPIEPALTTALQAGVATSQTNCWFVGRGGVVLVTSDGSTFRRVSVPEAVQLISVIAADGLRATVTAIDGRKFATIDGGLTWK